MNGIKKHSRDKRLVAFDSSVLIYHAAADPDFGPQAIKHLEPVADGKARGMISAVAVTEVLSLGRKEESRHQTIFDHLQKWLFGLTHIAIVDISASMAVKAARLRHKYGFRTPDALHLACAIESGADVFITNDKQLRKCKEISVRIL